MELKEEFDEIRGACALGGDEGFDAEGVGERLRPGNEGNVELSSGVSHVSMFHGSMADEEAAGWGTPLPPLTSASKSTSPV